MKKLLVCIALFVSAIVVSAQERVALVIGNSDYNENSGFCDLPMAENDAEDISVVLDSLGFDVTKTVNANEDDYDNAFNSFMKAAKGAKVIVVYYSGHGIMRGGNDFIVPVWVSDANNTRKLIQLSQIYVDLKNECGEDNLKLFIYDACRNGDGTVVGNGNNREMWDKPYLSKIGYPIGVQFVFSSIVSMKSLGGTARNSLFTEGLKKHINEPVELTYMFDRLNLYVSQVSKKQHKEIQNLTIEGNYSGEFYFNENKWSEYVDSITDKMSFSLEKLPDGRVRCKYENGDEYEGEWKNNKKNGNGVLKTIEGHVYTGQFKEGKLNGYGVLIYADSTRLEGQFVEGQLHGEGKVSHPSGLFYEGSFVKGEYDGFGKKTYVGGTYYEGFFKKGNRNGKGMEITPMGDTCRCEFVDELPEGEGVVTTSRGWSYAGHFKNGYKEGYGVLVYNNNQVTYKGMFEKDEPNGKGTMISAGGDTITGYFVKGMLEGEGRITTSHGGSFIGHFKNGKKDGYGKMIYDYNKGSYEGEWKNDIANGNGIMIDRLGEKYEGFFVDGAPEGDCVVTSSRNDTMMCTFKRGQVDGNVKIVSHYLGFIFEGEFREGSINGQGIKKFFSGATCEGEFVNGQLEGMGKAYIPGQITYEGEFKSDMMHGRGKGVFADGSEFEGTFMQGMKHGSFIMSLNGDTLSCSFLNNIPDGEFINKRSNGDVYYWEMENGKQIGDTKIEYKNGCVFIGQVFGFEPNGEGTMRCPNEEPVSGKWVNGKLIEEYPIDEEVVEE